VFFINIVPLPPPPPQPPPPPPPVEDHVGGDYVHPLLLFVKSQLWTQGAFEMTHVVRKTNIV
jgi:hypothetical protein